MYETRKYVLAREKALAEVLLLAMKEAAEEIAVAASKAYVKASKADLSLLTKAKKLDPVSKLINKIKKTIDGFGVHVTDALTPEIRKSFKESGLSAWSAVQVGKDVTDESVVEQMDVRALDFANERGAELVGKKWVDGKLVDNPSALWSINDTTRDNLRTLVGQAIEEGWSVNELKEAILDSESFSEARATLIARTELAHAHVAGNMEGWTQSGMVTGKRSILADTHPEVDICDDCANQGAIPLKASFVSGTQGPPYHPACLCDIIPVLVDDDEETLKSSNQVALYKLTQAPATTLRRLQRNEQNKGQHTDTETDLDLLQAHVRGTCDCRSVKGY